MAWIMKNSATMQIDRRDEPYLTQDIKDRFTADILPRYPTKQAATLPLLHAILREYGHVPHQAVEEVAEFLELEPSVVLDTATFYDQFILEPQGKYVIWLCQSISCELLGQPSLLERIQDKLGIVPGETTPDGRFTLRTSECLGSCGTAPVALVNEDLHENITIENFEKVLDSLE